MASGICLLSPLEVAQLENLKMTPSCCRHKHISIALAVKRIETGTLRLVADPRSGIEYVYEPCLRVLRVKKSGPGRIGVVQLVRGIPLEHIVPPTAVDVEKPLSMTKR